MSDERAGDCDGGHTEWGADPLKCWRADRRIRELSREVDTLRAQALATVPLADVLAWLDLPEGSSVLDAKEEARRLVNFVARVEDELDCGPVFKVVDRPPPARPPDGGDREPAAPTTNPSTISSKLVDGDTPPAVGDGCVDPCDDPRCTVHPPADVAPRPQAARGGEGEDEVRHLDEHNQELLKASDRLHWEIADLRAALSAARTFAEAKALGEVARVLDIYRAGVKAAQLEALDNGHAEQVERLGQRILAVTNIRAALAAHFSSHWPAGGDKD
jgi:hypothetical protein